MSYKSPVEIYMTQVRVEHEQRIEGDIIKAVHSLDIAVNKDELIKALRYDREQYTKGYHDGYNEDKWISCHEDLPEKGMNVLVWFEHFRYGNPHCPIQSVGIGHLLDRDYWFVNNIVYKGLTVFAWQPLPTRPTKFAIIKRGETH